MNAKQARELTNKVNNSNEKKYQLIINLIKNAASNGRNRIEYNGTLSDAVRNRLKNDKYYITDVTLLGYIVIEW